MTVIEQSVFLVTAALSDVRGHDPVSEAWIAKVIRCRGTGWMPMPLAHAFGPTEQDALVNLQAVMERNGWLGISRSGIREAIDDAIETAIRRSE